MGKGGLTLGFLEGSLCAIDGLKNVLTEWRRDRAC
jgi:hypothetical protein